MRWCVKKQSSTPRLLFYITNLPVNMAVCQPHPHPDPAIGLLTSPSPSPVATHLAQKIHSRVCRARQHGLTIGRDISRHLHHQQQNVDGPAKHQDQSGGPALRLTALTSRVGQEKKTGKATATVAVTGPGVAQSQGHVPPHCQLNRVPWPSGVS